MLTILAIIISVLYLGQVLYLRRGLARSASLPLNNEFEPTVTIVVAARNEEEGITECLESLGHIEYPKEKLDIVVVDDHSTDRTAELVDQYARCYCTIRLLHASEPEGNLRGKTNAVTCGIESSNGEIIMFTDADCRVSPTWVRETVKFFGEDIGVVGGFTVLEGRRLFEKIQSIDWLYLFGVSSATAGLHIPLTAIGNNLSIRRAAYDATGGYRKIPFSVTEDYSLVQAILQKTSYRLNFPLNKGTVAHSKACQGIRQLFRQKQRWGVGGLDMVIAGMLIMGIGWMMRAIFIVMLLVNFSVLLLPIGLVILLADLLFLWKPFHLLKKLPTLIELIVFELYFSGYVLLIPFVAYFSKNVVWKERKL